jgi:prevent-host-death family protein
MATINITNARKNLYSIVEEIQNSHEPLVITGKKGSAVLISEADWAAIQETLYLTSIPGMRESIASGMKEKLKDCSETLSW